MQDELLCLLKHDLTFSQVSGEQASALWRNRKI
jgi:hypothetical protein